MINKIAIDYFKGIKHLEIQGMKRLCLLSGKNNVGKSTVLEALFLFMDHTANDSFLKLDSFRGAYGNNLINIWESLFYNMDLEKSFSISIERNNREQRLLYRKDTDYLPYKVEGVSDDVLAQFRTATKEAYSLAFDFEEIGYSEEGHFLASSGGILRNITTSINGNEIKPLISTRLINAAIARSLDSVTDGIGKLELEGEKQIVVSILRELDSDIEDIVTISRNGISVLHIKVRGKWIPLQYAGDGVIKLLQICLAILERKNGLLLIDEIETGFHYSMYPSLWRIIDQISKKANCQVIATTHSYEMIMASKDNISDKENYVYYRLGRRDDNTVAYAYDHSMLDNALTSELEVR